MRNLIKSIRLLGFAFLLACTYQYLNWKYSAHTVPFSQVIQYCAGNQTMTSVCECFNYYGRQCLSSKRLVWDWVPGDEDPGSESASPEHLRDLIEEQEAEQAKENV